MPLGVQKSLDCIDSISRAALEDSGLQALTPAHELAPLPEASDAPSIILAAGVVISYVPVYSYFIALGRSDAHVTSASDVA